MLTENVKCSWPAEIVMMQTKFLLSWVGINGEFGAPGLREKRILGLADSAIGRA